MLGVYRDMQDNAAVGYALEHYLGATPGPAGRGRSGRSAARKSFDAACAQYDALLAQQLGDAKPAAGASAPSSAADAPVSAGGSVTTSTTAVTLPKHLSRSIRIFTARKE